MGMKMSGSNMQMNANTWSTEWTMQPWSWSVGPEVTSPIFTSTLPPIINSGQQHVEGGRRPNIDKIKEIFCARHPNNPKCQGRPEPPIQNLIPQTTSSQPQIPIEEPKTKPMPFGYLDAEARDAIIKNCKSGIVDCKSQPFGMEQKRNMVIQHEMDFARKQYSSSSSYLSPGLISKRIDLIHELKLKMIKVAGLGEYVTPVNDGTFEHDVLLTESQAQNLINALDQTPYPSNKKYGYGHGRSQRSSLFLDQLQAQRWPIGESIKYFIDANIAQNERDMLHQAHQLIQASTCIRFEQVNEKPQTDYLHYVKVATPTFCGLSYIGRVVPANPIYLSFQCQDPIGVAAHETMHALGANHEHLRSDRDEYINIQWENINPQFYDFFAIADPSKFTPFGVIYSFDSIMHYGAFTASLNNQKPTMVPKIDPQINTPKMGQRQRLSVQDIELLNKMYCKQSDCFDTSVYCGVWALRGFCSVYPQYGWMQQNCLKSCNNCKGGGGVKSERLGFHPLKC
uniref:Metalloendopeptidase n=1 Tax=Meloidogyne incognita TaxID=6306 RepID=A0A914N1B2_MELIC